MEPININLKDDLNIDIETGGLSFDETKKGPQVFGAIAGTPGVIGISGIDQSCLELSCMKEAIAMAEEAQKCLVVGKEFATPEAMLGLMKRGVTIDDIRKMLSPTNIVRTGYHASDVYVDELKKELGEIKCLSDYEFSKFDENREPNSTKRGYNERLIRKRRKKNKQARQSRRKNR